MGLQKPAGTVQSMRRRHRRRARGMRAGLNKVPIGGAFVDTTCALGPTSEHGSCKQRYRACAHPSGGGLGVPRAQITGKAHP